MSDKRGFGGRGVWSVSAFKATAPIFVASYGCCSGPGVGGLSGRASGLANSSGRLISDCQQDFHQANARGYSPGEFHADIHSVRLCVCFLTSAAEWEAESNSWVDSKRGLAQMARQGIASGEA